MSTFNSSASEFAEILNDELIQSLNTSDGWTNQNETLYDFLSEPSLNVKLEINSLQTQNEIESANFDFTNPTLEVNFSNASISNTDDQTDSAQSTINNPKRRNNFSEPSTSKPDGETESTQVNKPFSSVPIIKNKLSEQMDEHGESSSQSNSKEISNIQHNSSLDIDPVIFELYESHKNRSSLLNRQSRAKKRNLCNLPRSIKLEIDDFQPKSKRKSVKNKTNKTKSKILVNKLFTTGPALEKMLHEKNDKSNGETCSSSSSKKNSHLKNGISFGINAGTLKPSAPPKKRLLNLNRTVAFQNKKSASNVKSPAPLNKPIDGFRLSTGQIHSMVDHMEFDDPVKYNDTDNLLELRRTSRVSKPTVRYTYSKAKKTKGSTLGKNIRKLSNLGSPLRSISKRFNNKYVERVDSSGLEPRSGKPNIAEIIKNTHTTAQSTANLSSAIDMFQIHNQHENYTVHESMDANNNKVQEERSSNNSNVHFNIPTVENDHIEHGGTIIGNSPELLTTLLQYNQHENGESEKEQNPHLNEFSSNNLGLGVRRTPRNLKQTARYAEYSNMMKKTNKTSILHKTKSIRPSITNSSNRLVYHCKSKRLNKLKHMKNSDRELRRSSRTPKPMRAYWRPTENIEFPVIRDINRLDNTYDPNIPILLMLPKTLCDRDMNKLISRVRERSSNVRGPSRTKRINRTISVF